MSSFPGGKAYDIYPPDDSNNPQPTPAPLPVAQASVSRPQVAPLQPQTLVVAYVLAYGASMLYAFTAEGSTAVPAPLWSALVSMGLCYLSTRLFSTDKKGFFLWGFLFVLGLLMNSTLPPLTIVSVVVFLYGVAFHYGPGPFVKPLYWLGSALHGLLTQAGPLWGGAAVVLSGLFLLGQLLHVNILGNLFTILGLGALVILILMSGIPGKLLNMLRGKKGGGGKKGTIAKPTGAAVGDTIRELGRSGAVLYHGLLDSLGGALKRLEGFISLGGGSTPAKKSRRPGFLANPTQRDVVTVQEAHIPVWGVAGGHIAGSAAKFGQKNAQLGSKGEKIVGQKLESLTKKYPYVRVFHGLRFTPGKDGADIDHVVVMGRKVFLIDAKFWAAGSYSWQRGSSEVLRDGKPFPGGDVHMDSAFNKWNAYLGGLGQPQGAYITLAQKNGKYSINNRGAQSMYLITIDDLMAELDKVAAQEGPLVDRRVVYKVASQLQ